MTAVLARLTRALEAVGIDSPRLDARLLLEAATGLDRSAQTAHGERVLTGDEADALAALAARRLDRRPLAQVLGHRGFWSLDLAVTADVLTPRPDTETLVEAALAWAALDRVDGGGAHGTVLDFGTGSGCLLLSLLAEWPDARGVGVDISPQALAVAAGNARAAGLDGRATFVLSDWGAALGDARFDVIVANPPYIPDGDIDGLAPEVARHEPRLALSGGADGLDAYRLLANETARRLHPGGAAFFELGIGQADAVAGLMAAAGLAPLGLREDLSGVVRCLAVRANY